MGRMALGVGLSLLALGAALTSAQDVGVEQPKVLTSISAEEMTQLLDGLLLDYEQSTDDDGDPIFIIRFADYSGVLVFYDVTDGSAGALLFQAFFTSGEEAFPLEMVNNWNTARRYTRAYVDADGDAALESDLDLAGGVTEETIRRFIRTFSTSLPGFAEAI